jgi:hypothetical protein
MCTPLHPIIPQLRGGHQLRLVNLPMLIRQFLVLLGLVLVPTANSPGSGLPDIPFLCLCYVSMV